MAFAEVDMLVFCLHRTDEQKKQRYEEAVNGFTDFIPSMSAIAPWFEIVNLIYRHKAQHSKHCTQSGMMHLATFNTEVDNIHT